MRGKKYQNITTVWITGDKKETNEKSKIENIATGEWKYCMWKIEITKYLEEKINNLGDIKMSSPKEKKTNQEGQSNESQGRAEH